MAEATSRFSIQVPCVRMRENLGGERAIVIFATHPEGAEDNLVLATCIDAKGRTHSNVPFAKAALQYAFQHNRITLVEVEDAGLVVPATGLVGADGKVLK